MKYFLSRLIYEELWKKKTNIFSRSTEVFNIFQEVGKGREMDSKEWETEGKVEQVYFMMCIQIRYKFYTVSLT